MAFCKNHNFLYFDSLCRTKKSESVLSLIQATYQAKTKVKNKDKTKEEIARLLKSAYELFKFDAGSYTGDDLDQFFSQYTIGHELGIWVNSDLDLNDLALKVAKNEITIKDYFDIVFLNYIQPIDGKIIHPLYEILVFLKNNNKKELLKEDMKEIFSWTSKSSDNNINGLFNMLLGTTYFEGEGNDKLILQYPVEILIDSCNLECLKLTLDEANVKFSELIVYVNYLTKDNRSIDMIKYRFNFEKTDEVINKIESNNASLIGFNKIYYGIPGCGKSYKVASMLEYKNGFQEEANNNGIYSKIDENNIIRTTFYLDYSNSDFVGQIYPIVDDEGNVTYEPVPGPFTKALVRAYTNPNEMIYLVIEEINRGNAAAIFGDLFQLLDREQKKEYGKHLGESVYPISNEFIEGYLRKIISGKVKVDGDKSRLPYLSNHNIIIPNNLTIFATMNTSDQNVFPLDTAFKRRWNLERVNTDWSKNEVTKKYNLDILNKCIPFTDMTWGNFASSVNIKMVENSNDGIITQDKNLGPFFVNEDLLVEPQDRYKPENKEKLIQFVNNVIDYLFLDVTKFDHDVLFEKNISYSEVYDYFTETLFRSDIKNTEEAKRYLKIFGDNIQDDVDDELSRNESKNIGDINNGDTEEH